MLGPTSADATGKDFTDAKGRRWIAVAKVVPKEINVAETEAHNHNYRPAPPPPPQTLPVQYLAEKLRPRRLVGGYEYRLEQPDFDLAEKILFGGTGRSYLYRYLFVVCAYVAPQRLRRRGSQGSGGAAPPGAVA